MTKLPLIEVGEFSAAKTGIVDALEPIPTPRSNRQIKSCFQDVVKADPITAAKQNVAAKNIVPRRPKYALRGSERKQPLQ